MAVIEYSVLYPAVNIVNLIMVSYTISQPRLHTFLSEYHLTFEIRSPTRPACTYLHADTDLCISFHTGSFAEEVTTMTLFSFIEYRDSKYS